MGFAASTAITATQLFSGRPTCIPLSTAFGIKICLSQVMSTSPFYHCQPVHTKTKVRNKRLVILNRNKNAGQTLFAKHSIIR